MRMRRLPHHLFLSLLLLTVLFAGSGMDWESAKSVHHGIKLLSMQKKSPRLMRYYIMRIDLKTPGLSFVTTGRDPDWGKPMPDFPKRNIRTKRITTAEFMQNARTPVKKGGKGLNMVAAFNGAPWGPWQSPFTHKYGDPPGTMISNGVVVSDRKKQNPMFVVYRDGRVDILAKLPKTEYDKVSEAVPGFVIVARDGKVLPEIAADKGLAPRTAYGLSKDHRYFYVLVLDGRQKGWSLGASKAEIAQIMINAGASDAINMDGGGSSSMCVWDRRKKKPIMINRHDANRSYMRPVASNLGIVIGK